jgi:hypothetical protein
MFNKDKKHIIKNCSVVKLGDCPLCSGLPATVKYNGIKICDKCYKRMLEYERMKINIKNPKIISSVQFKDKLDNIITFQFKGFIEDYDEQFDLLINNLYDYNVISHDWRFIEASNYFD